MEELVDIVDSQGKTIYYVSRSQMRKYNLPHRSSHILVFNSRKELLVLKRSVSKDIYPGFWELGPGGVVCKGESYIDCATRELFEEVGAKAPLVPLFEMYFSDVSNNVLTHVFLCALPLVKIRAQKSEVAAFKWIPQKDILSFAAQNLVTPDSRAIYSQFSSEFMHLLDKVIPSRSRIKRVVRKPTLKKKRALKHSSSRSRKKRAVKRKLINPKKRTAVQKHSRKKAIKKIQKKKTKGRKR